MRSSTIALAACMAGAFLHSPATADWPQFRGPGGTAASPDRNLPVRWSAQENIAWRTELPGLGTSSPIVLGDRVFLTCYTGYGLSEEEPGEMDDLMRHVVCIDRRSGEILWRRAFEPDLPESQYQGNGARHGYSSATPTTDGERLYVFFGKSGVFALDLTDGHTLWKASVGNRTNGWGSSNSPVLYRDLLIVNASVESQSLVALDKRTGEEVWRAPGIRRSWSTPVLVEVRDSAPELVVSVEDWLLAFDPQTGKELSRAEGISDYICPSVIAHDGIVYAIGGRRSTATAVRAGGRGDVTDSHVLWRASAGSNVSSPVYHDGHLYFVHNQQGTAYCLDAKTGEVLYRERLEPRPGTVYSSPVVADGRIYIASQTNGVYVLDARPEYELIAHNSLDGSRTNASPAIDEGQILIRTDEALYCIGADRD